MTRVTAVRSPSHPLRRRVVRARASSHRFHTSSASHAVVSIRPPAARSDTTFIAASSASTSRGTATWSETICAARRCRSVRVSPKTAAMVVFSASTILSTAPLGLKTDAPLASVRRGLRLMMFTRAILSLVALAVRSHPAGVRHRLTQVTQPFAVFGVANRFIRRPHRAAAFAVVCAGQSLIVKDCTVVNPVVPHRLITAANTIMEFSRHHLIPFLSCGLMSCRTRKLTLFD